MSVSGINDDEFLSGRPYGGCAILYRSSLSSSITPLHSISNRFCVLKVKDQSGLSILLVCVYMPSSDIADYQDTLGALEGFIESYQCDINVIVGNFNADFSRQSAFTHHLSTLMTSLDLIACDLHSSTITYTYERDGGSVRSWIDHVLCNESYSNLINQLHPMNSGINLSDHLPISFTLNVSPVCVGHNSKLKCSPPIEKSCNWSNVEQHHNDKYRHLISADLPSLPPDLACCCEPDILRLDCYSATFVKCLVDAASFSIPHHSRPPGCTLAGWNHGSKQLKKQANIWYKVWLNAGCPSSGVLQQMKRKT